MDGENKGHGHVFKRPDGMLSRCGGPALCNECARDYFIKNNPTVKIDLELSRIYDEEFQRESDKSPGILAGGNSYRLKDAAVAAMKRAYALGKEAY